jgi:hypothetical protein
MDLARSVYNRDLKVATMRALDAGSATDEIARKYQLSPKLLERWRGKWRAKGELAFPGVGRRGFDLGGKSQGFGDAVWSTEVALSLLNCGMLFKERKWIASRNSGLS